MTHESDVNISEALADHVAALRKLLAQAERLEQIANAGKERDAEPTPDH